MKRLAMIIGPAPSELPFSLLLEKVRSERARVRRNLEAFMEEARRPTAKAPREKKTKAPSAEEQLARFVAEQMGISVEELGKKLERGDLKID